MLVREHKIIKKILISLDVYQKISSLSNILEQTYIFRDNTGEDAPLRQFVDSASKFIENLLPISNKEAKNLLYLVKFSRDENFVKIATYTEIYELLKEGNSWVYKIYK